MPGKRSRRNIILNNRLFLYVHSVNETVTKATANSRAAPKNLSNIDKLIQDIKGPEAISTVTKSSMDWDNFKESTGLTDELQQATKNGYGHMIRIYMRCMLFFMSIGTCRNRTFYCVVTIVNMNWNGMHVWGVEPRPHRAICHSF